MSRQEATDQMGLGDFGIRDSQYIDDPDVLIGLVRAVRETLRHVASQPRPKGIDFFEPIPTTLLMTALSLVDLRRLKQCPVCPKFIYAKRMDQTACTGKCSTTWRQRKFREKSPEYNKHRKQNRRAKEARADRAKKRLLEGLKRK